MGSVWANSSDEHGTVDVNGQSLHPGDIYLGDGTELLFNEALLDRPEAQASTTARLELRSWSR